MPPQFIPLSLSVGDAGYFVSLGSFFSTVFVALAGASAMATVAAPRVLQDQAAAGPASGTSRARLLRGVFFTATVVCIVISAVIYGAVHQAALAGWLQITPPDNNSNLIANGPSPSDSASPNASTTDAPGMIAVDLGEMDGAAVTAYFGQHRAVKDALDKSGVTMNQTPGFVNAFPHRCAEGIVIGPVKGDQGVLNAAGLGVGWSGLEWAPSDQVSADGGLLHQQFVSPPADLQDGSHFDVSAEVSIDGTSAFTHSFPLELTDRDGISTTWSVANVGSITCDVTS